MNAHTSDTYTKSGLTDAQIDELRLAGSLAGKIMVADTGAQRRAIYDTVPSHLHEAVRKQVEEYDKRAIDTYVTHILGLAGRIDRAHFLKGISDVYRAVVEEKVRKRFSELKVK